MITDAHLNPKVVKLINFQNSVILSKFDKKFSKVNQVIYFLAPISIPNLKALAQIPFEISYTQDFQDFFSKGDNSDKPKAICPTNFFKVGGIKRTSTEVLP